MKIKYILTNTAKIVAAASLAVILSGCGRKEVNVSDYVSLECSGYDTVGTAAYTIDIEKMIVDNQKAFDLSDGTDDRAYDSVYNRLSEALTGDLDKTDKLSNGDEIKFTWDDVDTEELEDIFPVTLTVSDVTLTVKGLEEAKKFDPFEYVQVTFDGIAPDGRMNYNVENSIPVSGLTFKADKTNGLSNGYVITITAETYYNDNINEVCLEYGMLPSATEKQYTVEGLSSYALSLDDIPEDALKKLDEHAQDTLEAHVAAKWSDSETFNGMELLGNYFLTPKDTISAYNKNYIYFIYRVDAKNVDTEEPFSYYYYSYYTDIMILDDGTCSFDLGTLVKPEGSMFFGSVSGEAFAKGDYYYTGYEDLDSLFNKQITSKIDSYKYQASGQELES